MVGIIIYLESKGEHWNTSNEQVDKIVDSIRSISWYYSVITYIKYDKINCHY